MFAPMGNPYAKNFTEEESTAIWNEMIGARRVMFRLAHYLPSLLPAYMQAGLMGKPVTIIKLVTKDASPKVRHKLVKSLQVSLFSNWK